MMLRPAFSAANAARITSITMKLGMALRAEPDFGALLPLLRRARPAVPSVDPPFGFHYTRVRSVG
jgi:hypothetical protein